MGDTLVKVVRDLFALCHWHCTEALLFLMVNALETRLKPLIYFRDYSLFL